MLKKIKNHITLFYTRHLIKEILKNKKILLTSFYTDESKTQSNTIERRYVGLY